MNPMTKLFSAMLLLLATFHGQASDSQSCKTPKVSLTPAILTSGGSTTLSWNLPGFVSVTSPSGIFYDVRGATGSVVLRPTQSKVIRLIAEPESGGVSSVFEIQLQVESVGGPGKIHLFSSIENSVPANQLTFLKWIVSGCSTVEIFGPGGWIHRSPCRYGEDTVGVALPSSGFYTLYIKDSLSNVLNSQIYQLVVN